MADVTTPVGIAYCDESDLLLGDIDTPTSMSKQSYIIRASRDVDIALSERFIVPIVTGVGVTPMVLRNVTADLASAYIIFSMEQPAEGNLPNAYAMHLYQRAGTALEPYRTMKAMPGAVELPTDSSTLPISVVQEDPVSLLGAYETFVTTPNPYAGEFYGPWTGRYGDGFQ